MNIRQSGKLSGYLFYKKFNNRNTWTLWKENIRNEEKIITAFYTSFFMFEILPLLFNLLTLKLEYNINDESLKLSESYSINR